MESLADILDDLMVITEERQDLREEHGQANEPPTYQGSPFQDGTELDRTVWGFVSTKVKAVKDNRKIAIEQEVKQKMVTAQPEEVASTMKYLAHALAKRQLGNTDSALYLQAAVDTANIFMRQRSTSLPSANTIRRVAAVWRNRFGADPVLISEHPRIQLSLDDLEHLLVDAGRDGWLNAEVMVAVMRLRMIELGSTAQVIDSHAWLTWVFSEEQVLTLSTPESNLVVPVKLYIPVYQGDSHWGLAVISPLHRRMYWLDSYEGVFITRDEAFRMMRNWITANPLYSSLGLWTKNEYHAP